MKQVYRDIAHPAFPYCRKHNRLFPHWSVGWLTPASTQDLHTFQAQCDVCRKEMLCNLIPSLRSKPVPAVKAS
jgi:hypothetical protein